MLTTMDGLSAQYQSLSASLPHPTKNINSSIIVYCCSLIVCVIMLHSETASSLTRVNSVLTIKRVEKGGPHLIFENATDWPPT